MSVITKTTHKNNQNIWSFILTSFFMVLFVGAVYALNELDRIPESISFFDTVIITLAIFRLTRLVVYDSVFRFFRDFFVQKTIKKDEDGNIITVRAVYKDGIRRTISDLLSCPWCIGMWLSLFVSFFFFATPYLWFPIFVLAVAGFSSLIQIAINLVGWRAEQLKGLVEADAQEDYDTERRDTV
ncbi:hypothetical protein CL654_02065 [bacterium]|nr:hypothetical protein [bacterium]|tara:strand:- start:10420 stop:10971 length:552 start_codon:yes stop_codon:yes gene_type:complete